MGVCGDGWGSVVVLIDGVMQGSTGSVVLPWCVCVYGEGGKHSECGKAVR